MLNYMKNTHQFICMALSRRKIEIPKLIIFITMIECVLYKYLFILFYSLITDA